jgi:folate-binding protein YgfZ|tara:strand:+ start:394 stop:1278 length:885 start_codon:yes stop_codon:yes gene_type:complete
MEKDQIILLEDRGLISITGNDAKDFLQNIITNDVSKVDISNSIFSGLFSPQGKYLFEFFLLKSEDGYLLDCDEKFILELTNYLSKYKLRSKVEIKNISNEYTVGILSLEKFEEIQKSEGEETDTIKYRQSILFVDPRKKELGARLLSNLEKLHLTIKKLNLKIITPSSYFIKSHSMGIPIKGVEKLKEQLFGLEANFEEFKAIDFKKGCYIGQENTARMKLKNKLRRKLLPINTNQDLNLGEELKYNNIVIGKVLIDKPLPFALIKLFDPDFSEFSDKEILINDKKVKLINILL